MFSQKFSDRYRGETDDGFEDKNLFEKCIIKPAAAVSGNTHLRLTQEQNRR
jgi:hypothetical protein